MELVPLLRVAAAPVVGEPVVDLFCCGGLVKWFFFGGGNVYRGGDVLISKPTSRAISAFSSLVKCRWSIFFSAQRLNTSMVAVEKLRRLRSASSASSPVADRLRPRCAEWLWLWLLWCGEPTAGAWWLLGRLPPSAYPA